jgi:hypothetical protein
MSIVVFLQLANILRLKQSFYKKVLAEDRYYKEVH